ncbi:MAG: hypothetical protein ABIS67_00070 [Candidatus Eisenbacteria bacterium]
MRRCLLILAGLLILGSSQARAQGEHPHAMVDLGRVGKTHFPVSCSPARQEDFDQAAALLHSFFYEESERRFAIIASQDPRCAMAWWGIAMSLWHPLWEPPDSVSLWRGWAAIQRADSIGAGSERERAYIAALAEFYRDWNRVDHRTRALAYERAMERLHAQYPDDKEASAFYALALNGTLQYSDKAYANQLRAGAMLEPLYAALPDHPGVAHYLIHSYDFPTLAARALPMARHYAEIAPHVPHALHMPSHIFTRLGMWREAVLSNLAAAQAGREYAATHHPGAVYYDAVHAWDYLEYAYLQMAQDRKAREIRDSVTTLRAVSHQTQSFFYALSSVPARHALEHHAWKEAAGLPLPTGWNWKRYPWTEATTHFARALGAARSRQPKLARESIARLTAIRDGIVNPGQGDWRAQVDAQRRTAAAWLALAEGRRAEALEGMRSAAALEDSTEKRPVTPGAVLPARELLADMLMEMRRPAEALIEYEAVLRDAPKRFNAVAGASRSALACRRQAEARRYAAELVDLTKDGDGNRPELSAAIRLLNGKQRAR